MNKIILDTNILITLFLSLDKSDTKSFFKSLIKTNKYKLYFSQKTYNELLEVIKYPKIQKLLDYKKISKLIPQIKYLSEFALPAQIITFERDPKDAIFLELALEVCAHYLVTNDKDLLDLKFYDKTRIINLEDFKRLF